MSQELFCPDHDLGTSVMLLINFRHNAHVHMYIGFDFKSVDPVKHVDVLIT